MFGRDATRCLRGTEYVTPNADARFNCGCVQCAPYAWCVPCRIKGVYNQALTPAQREQGSEPICARCVHNAKPLNACIPLADLIRAEFPALAAGPLKRSLELHRASQDAPQPMELDELIRRKAAMDAHMVELKAKLEGMKNNTQTKSKSSIDKVRPKPVK